MYVQSTVMELTVETNSCSTASIGINEVCCRSDVLLGAEVLLGVFSERYVHIVSWFYLIVGL